MKFNLGKNFALPESIITETIALAGIVGMAVSGTWTTYLSQLRTLGLITGSSVVSLSEEFK